MLEAALSRWRGTAAARLQRTYPKPEHVTCSYCKQSWGPWPGTALVESCRICRRPLVLAQMVNKRKPPHEAWNVIDLIEAGGGMALILLLPFIIFGPIAPFTGGKIIAIAVFVAGSVFLADGVLAMRTGVIRFGKHVEFETQAQMLGFMRVLFGLIAYGISAFGVAMFTRLI